MMASKVGVGASSAEYGDSILGKYWISGYNLELMDFRSCDNKSVTGIGVNCR